VRPGHSQVEHIPEGGPAHGSSVAVGLAGIPVTESHLIPVDLLGSFVGALVHGSLVKDSVGSFAHSFGESDGLRLDPRRFLYQTLRRTGLMKQLACL